MHYEEPSNLRFSTSTVFNWGLDNCCWDYLVHCRLFSSILVLYPLDVSSILHSLPTPCSDNCPQCLWTLLNVFLKNKLFLLRMLGQQDVPLCYSLGLMKLAQVFKITFSHFTDKSTKASEEEMSSLSGQQFMTLYCIAISFK